jgi:AcrR family transcriptional regulator
MVSTLPTTTRARTALGSSTKGRIIEAAEEVVLRDGVAHLTLDAAAAQAGLSKGGVLYHFPSRDSLVAGMVDKIIEEFDHDVDELLAADHAPGCFTRAYIRATLAPSSLRPDREDRVGAALIAAAAAEPALLVPLQQAVERWQQRVEADGIDPVVATAIRLAVDGLWMCDLFGMAPPNASRRVELGELLARMTERPT